MTSFVGVGHALARVRDNRLYHPDKNGEYESFELYCQERWGLDRSTADKQITAAVVTTIGVTTGLPAVPNEYATRPLVKVYNDAAGYDPKTETASARGPGLQVLRAPATRRP